MTRMCQWLGCTNIAAHTLRTHVPGEREGEPNYHPVMDECDECRTRRLAECRAAVAAVLRDPSHPAHARMIELERARPLALAKGV